MKKFIEKHFTPAQVESWGGILFLIATVIIGYFLISLSLDVRSIKSELSVKTKDYDEKLAALQSDFATSTKNSGDLAQQLAMQQDKSNNLDQTLSDIASTVGTLEKLSKTDKELLQKYSKVYFLNENYVPLSLNEIDQQYLQDKSKTLEFHTNVLPFLTRMLDDAANNSSTVIQIASAYRSFGTQASLKSGYVVTFGSGANKFSAEQGYSEHQLGTAIDLSAPDTTTLLSTTFENTAAYNWLVNNAYKYGFILSYPKGNSYYQYEPWHWRFVGEKLAKYLHSNKKNFYDVDQRFIDGYLATIFD
ncbi:TPA: hypothetical protein DCQ44_01770 [Candidatus Taylorbacteria bacterium]|nr:hypothetical protein [Candidatus Taylorbacteria bacterium]